MYFVTFNRLEELGLCSKCEKPKNKPDDITTEHELCECPPLPRAEDKARSSSVDCTNDDVGETSQENLDPENNLESAMEQLDIKPEVSEDMEGFYF